MISAGEAAIKCSESSETERLEIAEISDSSDSVSAGAGSLGVAGPFHLYTCVQKERLNSSSEVG